MYCISGGVKMSAVSGQVLTWHEDCLQCSVCKAGVTLDNVVFKENLFCKTCYLDTMLNKCDTCKQVTGAIINSFYFIFEYFRTSLGLATPSGGSSGMTPVSPVTSAKMSFRRGNSETWGKRSSVIPALEQLLGIYRGDQDWRWLLPDLFHSKKKGDTNHGKLLQILSNIPIYMRN